MRDEGHDDGIDEDEKDRCWSRGDGLHDYGRCKKSMGHDDEHEDEEGYRWL